MCAWRTLVVPLLALSLGMGFQPVNAAAPEDGRAQSIAKLFEAPQGLDAVFSPAFLAAIPAPRLESLFKDYHAKYGACTGARFLTKEPTGASKYELTFAKGFTVPMTLAIEPVAPHRVSGILLGEAIPVSDNLTKVLAEMKALPGEVSFCVEKLGGAKPVREVALNPETPLAVGSAFKLYVLGELMRQVQAGERSWSDVTELGESSRSLPSGLLHEWPAGSPQTLHALAGWMIARSDNTATDHLIHLLGRERIERVLPEMGNSVPTRNQPFLTTLEMFKLKWGGDEQVPTAFTRMKLQQKRQFLQGPVAMMARDQVRFSGSKPQHISTVEWFASTSDLCRAMAWIHSQSVAGKPAAARGILAINPGLDLSSKAWRYVGYKGGSEPGVLNMTFLLETFKGDWYAVSGSWNDVKAPVDENAFAGLMKRAIHLMEQP